MDYRKYQKIRAYCWQDLAAYIDTPSKNSTLEFNLVFSKIPALTEIDYERKIADGLFQCKDLTARESAAAHLLFVLSNHRAIAWWREDKTPDGSPPLEPLEQLQTEELTLQTKQAIFEYAAFLPEREAAALLGLVQTIEQTEPQAAPVVKPAASTPPSVATGDIAFAFDGLHKWSEKHWKKSLGNKPKWLEACIAIPGRRGVSETRWNPVLIGAALVRAGHAKPNNILARFQIKPQLKPWLETWKDYEADHFSTE